MKLLKPTGWQGFLGTIIAAPVSILLGFFYILPFVLTGQYKLKRRHGFILEFEVVKGSYSDVNLWSRWGGFGLGNFTIYNGDYIDNETTIIHERRHCQQTLTYGILMPLSYIGHMIWIYFLQKDKHPYIDCIWERDARDSAGQQVNVSQIEWYWGPEDRWPWF